MYMYIYVYIHMHMYSLFDYTKNFGTCYIIRLEEARPRKVLKSK